MPRSNQFFYNLSETPILSEVEAIDVLQEYCEEHEINPILLPNSVLRDFVSTVQYAPHEIETDEIARRTGVANHMRNDRPRYDTTQYWYSNYDSMAHRQQEVEARRVEPRVSQSSPSAGLSLQGVRRSTNFQNVLDNVLTEATPSVIMDTVEAMTTDADSDFAWITSSSAPKKKKRKRSEYDMAKEIVRGENFPRPNFKDFASEREYEDIIHDWYANVDYREQWIFTRREREGFNRRNIGYFSLDDVMARMGKRKKAHPLDSSFSKFYDWKLGGTDWILRLELFQHEQYYFLITRHIHKPTDTEIKFDVRYWNNERFKEINSVWCQTKNNDIQFDRVFGSNDENSPYYVRPYVEDEYDEDYYDFDSDDCEECEDSPF